jgi:hypothetical protein
VNRSAVSVTSRAYSSDGRLVAGGHDLEEVDDIGVGVGMAAP